MPQPTQSPCTPPQDLGRGLNGRLSIPLSARFPPALRELRLPSAGLRQAPLELGTCTALTLLDLASNPLGGQGLERLAVLSPSLCHLDLADCGLKGLPPALTALSRLTFLSLAGNPGLAFRPALLGAASQLRELSLARLGPWALPADLALLQALTVLDLSGGAGKEGLSNLAALAPLSRLRRLSLADCALRELPASGLEALTWLSLRDAIPWGPLAGSVSGLCRLRELDIAGCGLGALPPGVCALPALATLHVGPGTRLPPAPGQQVGQADSEWLRAEFGAGGPFAEDVALHRMWLL